MSLTRRFLSALGIEADKVDEIINAHVEVVDALKSERDKFKEDAEKLPKVQEELDSIKAATGDGGQNPFEVKYNELKEEFDTYKKGQEAKEAAAKVSKAYRTLLKEAGVSEKRIDAVLKVTNLDNVKLDKDGNIEGKDEALKNIKTEWADFISHNREKGADTANPPANNGSAMTKADILKIKDAGERQKAIAENHELFGF
jgi:hypothetical protein